MLPLKFLRVVLLPSLFVTLLLISGGCKKDQNQPPNNVDTLSNLLNDNVILLEQQAVKTVTANSVSLNNSKLTKMPVTGSIIAQSALGSDLGFLRRVTEVFDAGNDEIFCNTESCTLGDAFKTVNVNQAYKESFESSFNAREGASLTTNFDHTTFANALEVNGSLKLNVPTVKIEYQKKASSNAPETIVVLADINTEESELELTHTEDATVDLDEFPLKQFNLPTIYVKIPIKTEQGTAELVVPFTQKILLYVLPLSIRGRMKLHLNPIIHATVGCRYDVGDWQNLSINAIDATNLSQFCSNDFSISNTGFSNVNIFSPVYEIAPYGSDALKGSFQLFNGLSMSVNAGSPNFSLDYISSIQGSVNLNFWDGTNRSFGAGAEAVLKNLAAGDFANCRSAK